MAGAGAFQIPASTHPDEARAWAGFAGAKEVNEFCASWLALQCIAIARTTSGVILIEDEPNTFIPAGIWPDETQDVSPLAVVAEKSLRERRGIVERGTEGAAWVAYPVMVRGRVASVVVIEVESIVEAELAAALRALHWGAGWLETVFLRRGADEDGRALARTRGILDLALTTGAMPSASAASISLVNALAARLDCRHVAIGAAVRGGIKVLALSHTALIDRRSRLAVALAHAMEEALDQGLTISHPAAPGAHDRITLAHRELANEAGLRSVLSFVMMAEGRPVGVITLGRDEPEPFDAASVAFCEAAADLLGTTMVLQQRLDSPLAGRIPSAVARGAGALFGRRHPTVKLAAGVIAAALACLVLIRPEYRVSAKAVLEGSVQRVAAAPYEGFIATAPHRAGDTVEAGETLATLDTREIALEALRYGRQRDQAQLRQRDALARDDRPAAAVQMAAAAEAEAQRALAEFKLERGRIAAPFRGLIVSGDFSQSLGSPVEKGKVLFEIAPLEGYRVNLQVDERDIARLRPGDRGHLLLAGLSSDPYPFVVTKIVPVATAAEGRNTFRVEAALDSADAGLRPGMEGVGKVDAGRASLLWIWTHSLIDWARLTLWEWTP
jgi:multidrug resistance efflux pump